VDPSTTQTLFKTIRCTRGGEVLLELQSTQNKTQFSDEVRRAVGSDAVDVRDSIPKTTVEIRDIDACTTENEVRQAIIQAGVEGDLVIRLTNANNRGQRLAIATAQETEAVKLLKTGKLKVGWVICRVRRRTPLVRCFRCLDYGHHARDCKGTDRANMCYKCGQVGHLAATCNNEPHCAICAEMAVKLDDQKHILGTTKCRALKLALEKRKVQLQNGRKN